MSEEIRPPEEVETVARPADLEHYHKEIYIIILGLGFALFTEKFANDLFNNGDFRFTGLVFFCSLYYFFSYDWIAYTSLMRRFPYNTTGSLLFLGRFYTDLFILLIKACLIFIATQRWKYSHLVAAAILFALWHCSILVWYYFREREYGLIPGEDRPKIWLSHIYMVVVYLVLSLVFLLLWLNFSQELTSNVLRLSLLTLCGCIVTHATLRQWYLLRRLKSQRH